MIIVAEEIINKYRGEKYLLYFMEKKEVTDSTNKSSILKYSSLGSPAITVSRFSIFSDTKSSNAFGFSVNLYIFPKA